MARYIDINEIKFTGAVFEDRDGEIYIKLSDVKQSIEQTPTADVEEVKHGEWKNPSIKRFEGRYLVCSECDVILPIITELLTFDFCPRCGAKMDGRSDER